MKNINFTKIKNILLFGMMIFFIQSCEHFMYTKVFKHIDNCTAEYYKYHPNAYNKNIASKTCSRVKNRMCVINKYCKGDQTCIAEAKRVYPPYNFGDGKGDTSYCEHFAKRIKKEMEERSKNEK